MFQLGSCSGTHSTLSSSPLSSRILNSAIGLTGITQPGKVGSETTTIASSGSPSAAEGLGDEAVVGRIDDRGEQEAIELDRLQLVVPLVLVADPLGISTRQCSRCGSDEDVEAPDGGDGREDIPR